MKRRAFLGGLGAAGGVALTSKLVRAAAAPRPRLMERLREAKIGIVSRVTFAGPKDAETVDVALEAVRPGRKEGRLVSARLATSPASGRTDAIDLLASFRARTGGRIIEHNVGFKLGAWSRDSYLALPGLCYAGNRFSARHVSAYPPLLTEPADIGPHVPPIIADIPRLNVADGPSSLETLAADLATPAAALFLPALHLGIILLAETATPAGRTGIAVGESDDRAQASVSIRAPFVPADPRAGGKPTRERGTTVKAGAELTMRARLFLFDCADVPGLFARLFAIRKDLTGATTRVRELPFSAAFAAHEERVNRRWVDKPGFFAAGARDSAYATWQTGWCGGLAQTLPLLAAGGKPSRERALATIGFALDGQAPSGFFHAMFDGKVWHDDGFSAPLPGARPGPAYRHARRWHLARRSADALTFLLKQLPLIDPKTDPKLAARWNKATRQTADAFVRLWERHHQFGQFVDVESGELVVGGSTSAGLAPAGLALASGHFKEPRYMLVAKAAGEHYFDRYVRVGLTCGGPGDALQSPDSESAAALLESFVTLYETTGERVWIERAETTAHLLASWVISYDDPPPGPGCPEAGKGAAKIHATGGVLSDAQSRRGAPGYRVLSGDALFRLYRATGDVALLELLRDTVSNLAQYLRRADPTAGPQPTSELACARAETGEWLAPATGIVPAGEVFDAIALLAYTEVPGLYAQVDKGFVFAFDHIEVKVKERLAGKLVVKVTNPTEVEAKVRWLSETSSEAATPLGAGRVAGAPVAVIPPGTTVELVL